MNTQITVETLVNTNVVKAWDFFTLPEHIKQWNFAAPEWHCPEAENDLQVGGKFNYRMAAKDGSFAFDFFGVYDVVDMHRYIKYTMGDNRVVEITFSAFKKIKVKINLLQEKHRLSRHVGALADHVMRNLKDAGVKDVRVEGLPQGDVGARRCGRCGRAPLPPGSSLLLQHREDLGGRDA